MADKQPLLPQPYSQDTPAWYNHQSHRERRKSRTLAVVAVCLLSGLAVFRPWHWHRRWHSGPAPIIIGEGGSFMDENINDPDFNPFDSNVPIDENWDCEILTFEKDADIASYDFKLTTEAEKIRLWNRGPLVGNITIESGGTSGDDVEVDLTFEKPDWFDEPFDGPECSRHVKICRFHTSEGAVHSIGIYVPRREHHDHSHPHDAESQTDPKPPVPPKWPLPTDQFLRAVVAVRFPSGKEEEPVKIKHFASGLAAFKHEVGDLNVVFEKLDLVGGLITAAGASAADLSAVSVFWGIKGNFSASRKLDLVASHGPIDVNVDLYNSWEELQPSIPTKFDAVTSDGALSANVSLLVYNSEPSNYPPSYIVEATSSHGTNYVDIETQPVGSLLKVDIVSNNHPSTLSLAPAFEGTFQITAVNSKPEISVNEETEDPSGENRKRVVKHSRTGWIPWFLEGSVQWVKTKDDFRKQTDAEKRSVNVVATNAPGTIILA